MTHPKDCPKFPTCNAALCPLDEDWRKRSCAYGDTTCLVVREHVKEGADARFAARPVFAALRPHAAALLDALRAERDAAGADGMRMGRSGPLRAFEAAREGGSQWERGEQLHAK